MNQEDIRQLYQDYNSLAVQEAKENAVERKNARGILKDQTIAKILRKEYGEPDIAKIARKVTNVPAKYTAAQEKQGIVLAYGMSERSYTIAELCDFVMALEKTKGKFQNKIPGVPYASLLRASRQVDKERAKCVRNATFYQRRGNVLYFQVTGNSKPYYRVQIRLENWDNAILGTDPVFLAVKKTTSGRISIECPCGRHQYWYRYMASLGGYGLKPIETGYPKIRNRNLTGCCCKHVLRVLTELKSNRLILLLSKELEMERNRSGYSNTPGTRLLSAQDLRISESQRLIRDARAAFEKYRKEADELKKNSKPRKTQASLLREIRKVLATSKKKNIDSKAGLQWVGAQYGISLQQIRKIITEHELE